MAGAPSRFMSRSPSALEIKVKGMTTEAKQYINQADIFLRDAQEELEGGNLRQAGAKAWEAAVQAIKAVSQARGWAHESYRQYSRTISRLTEERKSFDLLRGYASAQSLFLFSELGGFTLKVVIALVADVHNLVSPHVGPGGRLAATVPAACAAPPVSSRLAPSGRRA